MNEIPLKNREDNNPSQSESTKRTWSETISDDENLWLKAVRAEREGDYLNAALAYTDDALKFMRDAPSRVGISCANAAECFIRIGLLHYAKQAYEIAAHFFMLHAENMITRFPRESLWALNRAYQCFHLAGDERKAEKVASQIALINSLIGESSDRLKTIVRTFMEKEEGRAQPILRLFMSELTKGTRTSQMSQSIDENHAFDGLAESVEAKLQELSAIFKQRVGG